jgi:ubiquitin C-terminal hydrolase
MTSIDNVQSNITTLNTNDNPTLEETIKSDTVDNIGDAKDAEDEIGEEPVKFGVSKYKNIMGITCYMNSILHILQQTPVFLEYITQAKFRDGIMQKINKKISSDPSSDEETLLKEFVIFELFRLFKTSLENDDSSITPTTFKALIGKKNDMWNEYNHQDSQEFFNFLISQLEEEAGMKSEFIPGFNYCESESSTEYTITDAIKNTIATNSWTRFQAREYSPLKNLFDGLVQNNRKCMCCNTNSIAFEPFLTLPVSVPIKDKSDMIKTFNIYDCIDHFVSEEQLDADNKMNCEMCGLRNRGHSKTLLWKTPKILVLHIKRFLVNAFGIPTQKITNNVTYPIKDLDLSKYFDPASPHKSSCKYDLIGINIHQAFGYGNNINAGHYTSIVKNIMNNNWYLYNDSNQVKMAYTKENLQSANAYLLFYYRHD